MSAAPIRSRIAVTFAGNAARSALSFLTGVVLARALGPGAYGEFSFLVGSFAALKQVLDLGTSNAFYTFISQRARGARFVAFYAGWQAVQLALTLVVVGLAFPERWVDSVWQGHPRAQVLLAFLAVFLQQQAWITVTQLGEAARETATVQAFNILLAALQLAGMLGLWAAGALRLETIFAFVAAQYAAAFLVGARRFWPRKAVHDPAPPRAIAGEYIRYCLPFVFIYALGFLYSFTDTWLLRHFAGPRDMAYFSVANQFSMMGFLVASSIIPVFWREIAEAHHQGDAAKVERLHRRASRLVFVAAAAIAGLLIPWSSEILAVALGEAYRAGAVVLGVMLLYPIYVSVGQLGSSMLLATGRTRSNAVIGGMFTAISIPVSYFVQASPDAAVPGLGLGALGMALKMVALVTLNVLVLLWWIGRSFGWRPDWAFQALNAAWTLALGWAWYWTAQGAASLLALPVPVAAALHAVGYGASAAALVFAAPSLVGVSRADLRDLLVRIQRRFPGAQRRSV